jgi:hypothetical protein
MWEGSTSADQLAALGRLDVRFADEGLEYGVFERWAVDLHGGVVTRAHDDVDVAVWAADADRVARALELDGWTTVPQEVGDGYRVYARDGVRLEVAFLAHGGDGGVHTPLADGGRAPWPQGAFGDGVAVLGRRGKDRADSATLNRLITNRLGPSR